MSDLPLSPDHDLASAYVDGLATAPERAQVEASPELMALVQSFRAQRAALADVPTASDAVREASFAAALAAFDALPSTTSPQVAAVAATAPVAPPTNVVSIDRHRRWNRVLGAAAAVAFLGLAGVAVANLSTGSSDGDSASMATNVAQEADTKVGLAGVTDPSNLSPTLDPSQPPETSSGAGGVDTTAGSPGTIDSINSGGSAVPALSDTSSLRALPPPTNEVSPSFVLDCPLTSEQTLVLEITWKGTPAVVVRDTVTGVITVLDAQCNTLVTVGP